ncbi:MAG TPA: STAS/SEC14 domain-containing protein [Mucilaginibacter sp.]|jgi:hypothetical protein|nr:STAS/SEC14 domain-containing protein [Mucilaginibacter sp.]
MLQFIKNLPDHVVGIRAIDEVDKEDYEKVLIPRMEELVERQGEINYLLVLETDVQNFSVAAWFEDFKLGLKNFRKWNKVAIVTDQKGVEWLADISRHLIPGESRGFKLSELSEAIEWVSKTPHHEYEEITVGEVRENIDLESSNKGQGPSGENL